MKILHISTSNSGGAANATRRIHEGLLRRGIDSKWLVLVKKEDETPEVYPFYSNENILQTAKKAYVYVENKIKLIGRDKKYEVFSSPRSLLDISKHPLFEWADIVNLHWVAYFLDYKKYFSKNKPTVWRLSDMAAFTGGCHYTYECEGFTKSCEECPQLAGTLFRSYAKNNFLNKQEALKTVDKLAVVGVTDWVADEARKSSLFKNKRILTIENSINTEVFKPYQKKIRSKTELLIVADDFKRFNKGFDLLKKAINKLQNKDQYKLIVVGKGLDNTSDLSIEIQNNGFIKDKKELALLFSQADISLIPSRYETFNQTTIESMACGTPVLAFDNSGPSKIIKHKESGYLAKAFDPEDFCKGIEWIEENIKNGNSFKEKCLELIRNKYTYKIQADKYIELYQEILNA